MLHYLGICQKHLKKICLKYMFFMIDTIDIASYAVDNTHYSVGKNKYDLET